MNEEENNFSEKTNKRTSIRDIKISKKREHIDSYSSEYDKTQIKQDLPLKSTSSYKERNKKKWPKVVIVLVIFFLLFSAINIFFHSSKITVIPKTQKISFNKENTYQAKITLDEDEKAPNVIKYEVENFSFSVRKELDSIGVEKQEAKATGKIKIINNSDKAQKLRKETRFRTGEKIFMTYKSVTVPANSSVIAKAFATEPGPEFNLKKGVKLDIPGFEEVKSPLFDKMSGEISEDFVGGNIGNTNTPRKSDLEEARKKSKEELELMADTKIINNIKSGYLLVNSNYFRDFSEKITSEGDKVILTTDIDVKTIVFKEKDFLKTILNLDDQEGNSNLKIKNTDKLKFNILTENLSVSAGDNFDFNIEGSIELFWKLDKDVFLNSIKGKTEEEVSEIIKNDFKNFDINISITPFWRSSIPDSKDDIELIIKNN